MLVLVGSLAYIWHRYRNTYDHVWRLAQLIGIGVVGALSVSYQKSAIFQTLASISTTEGPMSLLLAPINSMAKCHLYTLTSKQMSNSVLSESQTSRICDWPIIGHLYLLSDTSINAYTNFQTSVHISALERHLGLRFALFEDQDTMRSVVNLEVQLWMVSELHTYTPNNPVLSLRSVESTE